MGRNSTGHGELDGVSKLIPIKLTYRPHIRADENRVRNEWLNVIVMLGVMKI